jgi:hypothetical protein
VTIRERDSKGRARSQYANADLYDVVAEVAVLVDPLQPETLTVRDFNQARAEAGHSHAPSASGICQRLSRNGKPGSWNKIVATACDESASVTQIEGKRNSVGIQTVDSGAIFFALRVALQWHQRRAPDQDITTLVPSQYDEARTALIEKSLRKRDRKMVLHECLPTEHQITTAATNLALEIGLIEVGWNAALEIAELLPRSSRSQKAQRDYRGNSWERALPIEQLIHYFIEENNFLPTQELIESFARQAKVALEARKGRAWSECLEAAVAYRSRKGLSSPRSERNGVLSGTTKPFKVPATGIPGAKPAHAHTTTYTEDDLIDAVVDFLNALNPEMNPSQRRYRSWATRHGKPSAGTLARNKSWSYFLKKARERRNAGKAK